MAMRQKGLQVNNIQRRTSRALYSRFSNHKRYIMTLYVVFIYGMLVLLTIIVYL